MKNHLALFFSKLTVTSIRVFLALKQKQCVKLIFLTFTLIAASFQTQALTKYSSCDHTNEYSKRCFYYGAQGGVSILQPNVGAGNWVAQNTLSGAVSTQLGWRFASNAFTEVEVSYLGANTLINKNDATQEKGYFHYFTPAAYLGIYLLSAQSFKKYNIFAKLGVSSVQNISSSDQLNFNRGSVVQPSFVFGAEFQIQPDIFSRISFSNFTQDASMVTVSIHRFF